MKELAQWYRVLGLEFGASWEEVNQAYKDLAFIWHPDRIPTDNPRLQEKAEEKLKEINHARDQLRSRKAELKSDRHGKVKRSPAPKKTSPKTSTAKTSRDRPKPPPHRYYRSNQSNQSHRGETNSNYYQRRSAYSYKDLSGSDFRGADLKEKDLSGRNLSNANLTGADLSDAFLHKINLTGANLENANLFRANLLEASLIQASLRNCNLIGADLSGADLSGADLTGAKVGTKNKLMVKLTGTKLSGAIMPDGTIYP